MLNQLQGWLHQWVLTLVIFAPLGAAVMLLFFPKRQVQLIRNFALIASGATFVISLILWRWFHFRPGDPDPVINRMFQLDAAYEWIPQWGINYHVGIDGISLLLIMLTTFLTPLVILSTYHAIENRVKEFMIFMLILETAMIGTFASLNMFLFYVFWELMLVPMYFIIGVWGGERRIYAAIKFFLFTMTGSVLMLIAILTMAWLHKGQFGTYSFEYADMLNVGFAHRTELLLFGAFGLAFAIKVPMFPFHTWLPDAHVEAPTAGSVILAGVLLKMGTYGLLRFCIPFFPGAVLTLMPLVMVLAVVGIIYGALVSMVQPDLKKLVAYSSVSHLGFVVLGMFALNRVGIQGSVLQMINHGLSTGALFLLVGVIYERRHTRLISEFGGLARVMPIYGTVFMIAMLSSVGLPGLNGFVGEFLILLGAFTSKANPWMKIYAALAATGVIFAAVYLLWMFQRVMFGPVKNPKNETLPDLNMRELATFLPILLFMFWIGLYPKTFTDRLMPSVTVIVNRVMPESEADEVVESAIGPEHGATAPHAAPAVGEPASTVGTHPEGEPVQPAEMATPEATPEVTPQPAATGEQPASTAETPPATGEVAP